MQRKTGAAPPKKPGRIGLPVIPPKGHPFAGATGLNAPARNTKIPNLTAHVAVAKAAKSALTQGGLIPEAQRKAASDAGKALNAHKQAKRQLANAPKTAPAPRKGPGIPAAEANRGDGKQRSKTAPLIQIGAPPAPPISPTLPAWLTKPAVSPTTRQSTPAPASSTTPSPGSRGATPPPAGAHPQQVNRNFTPANPSSSLGGIISTGLGTALSAASAIPQTLLTPIHPGATHTAAQDVRPTHLAPALTSAAQHLSNTTNQAASALSGYGLTLPKTIPSVDLVPGAGAASNTTYTPQQLVAAGMTPEQTKHFRDMAINQRHWYPQEIDGLVGLDLIKHAFNSPPPLPLRILQNGGAGLIRTGSLPVAGVAVGKEIASGHGLRAIKEIGNVAASQFGGMIQHPGQAFVSDPYTFIPTAGGALKTLGGIGGKVAEKAGRQAVERSVEHAVTGEVIPRGVYDRNLYVASGQHLKDAATERSAFLSKKLDAQRVEQVVADVSNESAPMHHEVQTAYAQTFKRVGPKRAAILMSLNKAGGKPEKILAFYQHSGNARQVKHWTQVVAAAKHLTEKDHAFIAAHKQMAGVENPGGTTATNMTLGRFGDAAAIYRAHQPLILSDAHAGDPVAQRVQALHDEWITANRKTEDPAELEPLHGAYDHAVREFAQAHLDSGGSAPTRVQYTKPPATGVTQPLYRVGTGGKVRFNRRVPGVKASTGAAFESGDYLIDPKAALRENLQAQRLRTSIGLTSDENLAKVGAIQAAKGDPRPHGYTFTPQQNPATVGKVITDLNDSPVGAHDYYHRESDIRSRFASHLEHTADSTGEYASEKGWFVPDGAFNRILDYTRPESRNAYDKFMRQYQRAMISIFPSTLLGNTVGSVPLALAAGAGPKSFLKARESSSLGGDITLAPHSLHGRGVAGNLAADARNPLSIGMNKMRRGNVIGEDFSRDAAYFSKAIRGAKARSRELGYDDVNSYLRDMASGKVDPHIRDAAIAHAIKFAGDAAKPQSKVVGKWAGRVVLFPQWLQHMTKLMLVTLPLHHPRRMALINAMAAYGDQYRKEHGALPSWMQEFAPLFDSVVGKDTFTRVAGLGQLAPQGTAGGVFDTLGQSKSWPERIGALANPPVAAGFNSTVVQPIKNASSPYPVDLPRYALNQALYTVPGMSKFFPRTGMESDSLPWSPRPFHYTDGTRKTAWHDHTLPFDQRPGVRPVGGPLGIASRVFGLPLYDVPSSGPINKATVDKAIKKAQPKTKAWG